MKIEIKHWRTSEIIFECGAKNLFDAVAQAVKKKKDLGGADLRGADLTGADLTGAGLTDA